MRATFTDVPRAVTAVTRARARACDSGRARTDRSRESLAAVSEYLGGRSLAPAGTGALLLIEVDGLPEQVDAEARAGRSARAATAGATEILRAAGDGEREELWRCGGRSRPRSR